MKDFKYILKAKDGIHARPAGVLVQNAAKFKSEITIKCKDKEGSAKKLFALMKLGAKMGDEIIVIFDGEDEALAFDTIKKFIEENF